MTNKKHEFSPIINESKFRSAMEYIAVSSLDLAITVLGRELIIDTICFFAQSPEEYDYLLSIILNRGIRSKFSHGPTTYVDTNLKIAGQTIKILGVRQPDPSRPWVGYGDYPLTSEEYSALMNENSQFVEEIKSGRGEPLLELKHPNFDVLGYAFHSDDHA